MILGVAKEKRVEILIILKPGCELTPNVQYRKKYASSRVTGVHTILFLSRDYDTNEPCHGHA